MAKNISSLFPTLYAEFELDGQPVAAFRAGSGPLVTNDVQHTSQRIAFALRLFGRDQHNPTWIAAADRITSWSLAAPQRDGFFPTTYDTDRHEWVIGCRNGERPSYSVARCALVAYWLLEWHGTLASDPRVLPFANRLATTLIECIRRDGSLPVQVEFAAADKDSLEPATANPSDADNFNPLTQNSKLKTQNSVTSVAVGALFLAELSQFTGSSQQVRALTRLCEHLLDWLAGGPNLRSPAHRAALSLGGQALLKAYRLTGDRRQPTAGCAAADFAHSAGLPHAELFAAAYRLSREPRYAEYANEAVRAVLAQPRLDPDSSWAELNGFATWATLSAHFPDILVLHSGDA